jgi:hypothetical protein
MDRLFLSNSWSNTGQYGDPNKIINRICLEGKKGKSSLSLSLSLSSNSRVSQSGYLSAHSFTTLFFPFTTSLSSSSSSSSISPRQSHYLSTAKRREEEGEGVALWKNWEERFRAAVREAVNTFPFIGGIFLAKTSFYCYTTL